MSICKSSYMVIIILNIFVFFIDIMCSMVNYKEYFLLDPDVVFLNHGSFGATPKPVMAAYQSWQNRLERQPVLFLGREYDELLYNARVILGRYVNACAEDLVYVPNATYGVNVIAHSLKLKPGDEILTSDHEYGACDYTWEFICGKTGAKYIHQPFHLPVNSEVEIVEQLWRGVSPRTKAIFLSHITSPTALKLPVEEITKRARQQGILTIFDGAHAMGQIPLDLSSIDPDFYTSNCHKWSLAPKGSAFLYARRDVQNIIEPLIVSWGYGNDPKLGSGSRFVDFLQWTGTKDPSAALAVPDAIKFMEDFDWESVRSNCKKLLKDVLARISQITDLSPIYPLESDFYIQMGVALIPESTDLALLKKRIYDEFKIEVPFTQLGNNKFIRVSVQAYNSISDLDALVNALEMLIPQVSV